MISEEFDKSHHKQIQISTDGKRSRLVLTKWQDLPAASHQQLDQTADDASWETYQSSLTIDLLFAGGTPTSTPPHRYWPG